LAVRYSEKCTNLLRSRLHYEEGYYPDFLDLRFCEEAILPFADNDSILGAVEKTKKDLSS